MNSPTTALAKASDRDISTTWSRAEISSANRLTVSPTAPPEAPPESSADRQRSMAAAGCQSTLRRWTPAGQQVQSGRGPVRGADTAALGGHQRHRPQDHRPAVHRDPVAASGGGAQPPLQRPVGLGLLRQRGGGGSWLADDGTRGPDGRRCRPGSRRSAAPRPPAGSPPVPTAAGSPATRTALGSIDSGRAPPGCRSTATGPQSTAGSPPSPRRLGQRLRDQRHEHQQRNTEDGDPECAPGPIALAAPGVRVLRTRSAPRGGGSSRVTAAHRRRRRRPHDDRRRSAEPERHQIPRLELDSRQVSQRRRSYERPDQTETADHQRRRGREIPDRQTTAKSAYVLALFGGGSRPRRESRRESSHPAADRAFGRARARRGSAATGSPRRDRRSRRSDRGEDDQAAPLDTAGSHQHRHQGEDRAARRPEASTNRVVNGSGWAA